MKTNNNICQTEPKPKDQKDYKNIIRKQITSKTKLSRNTEC